MARLIWAPQAAEDLTAICTFIARDSEGYARELLHGHCRIIYEVGDDAVHILAVHHGARLLRERPSR